MKTTETTFVASKFYKSVRGRRHSFSRGRCVQWRSSARAKPNGMNLEGVRDGVCRGIWSGVVHCALGPLVRVPKVQKLLS